MKFLLYFAVFILCWHKKTTDSESKWTLKQYWYSCVDAGLDKQEFPQEQHICHPGTCRWKASDLFLESTELVGSSDDNFSKLTCSQEFDFIDTVNVTKCLMVWQKYTLHKSTYGFYCLLSPHLAVRFLNRTVLEACSQFLKIASCFLRVQFEESDPVLYPVYWIYFYRITCQMILSYS